jgi:hypothetical protein
MGKKRRIGNVIRRMSALALALVLGFSGVSEHVTVYAANADVPDGSTTVPTSTVISGGGDVYFSREAVYIAVTPVYDSNATTDISGNNDSYVFTEKKRIGINLPSNMIVRIRYALNCRVFSSKTPSVTPARFAASEMVRTPSSTNRPCCRTAPRRAARQNGRRSLRIPPGRR